MSLFFNLEVSGVYAQQLSYHLDEYISISIYGEDAQIRIYCDLFSSNLSILSFPEDFNLNDSNLANATSIRLSVSKNGGSLSFTYSGISIEEAKKRADAMISQANAAFNLSFNYYTSMNVTEDMVLVEYIAEKQLNMKNYVISLISKCLAPETGGLSEVVPKIAELGDPNVDLMAEKWQGSPPIWQIELSTMTLIDIPTGTGSHTIDILRLLGVSELAPSPYAKVEAENYYSSSVEISISSPASLFLENYQPNLQSSNPTERGWKWIEYPTVNYTFLTGIFYFRNDGTPVNELTFTFNGTIIPEIMDAVFLVIILMITSIIMGLKRKKLRWS